MVTGRLQFSCNNSLLRVVGSGCVCGRVPEKKMQKEDVPRPGIEPGIFRLQLTITAGRHNQLDHQGLSVSIAFCFN